MVNSESGTAGTAFLHLYAHACVTHSIRVGKGRHIRNIDSGKYFRPGASGHSLIRLFSFSIYPSNYLSKLPTNYPAKMLNHTSEVFTLCLTR
jgi:hypothetical protein